MSGQIFISYSRRDQEFVFKLANDLEARGGKVWLDQADIRGGTQWRDSIARGIQQSGAFLLLISPDAMSSDYVNIELEIAEEVGKPIFPLIYRRTSLPENLSRFQFVDFTKGGYQKNLTDLLAGLSSQGIDFHSAPELSPEELASRRRELLGAPVKVRWGTVLKKIPGWAFAWGLGWGIYWIILAIFFAVSGDEIPEGILFLPIGGFFGGLLAGFLAGFATMIPLRHNAANIDWKHMKSSIRIWELVGPIGTIIAGWLAIALFNFERINLMAGIDCADGSLADCLGEMVGGFFGTLILGIVVITLLILAYVLFTILILGLISGWFAVRHIRRLEPGILGKQAVWVIIGWGLSAPLAALLPLILVATFLE